MLKTLVIIFSIFGPLSAECVGGQNKPPSEVVILPPINPYNKVLWKLIWEDGFGKVIAKKEVWLTYEQAVDLGMKDYISEEVWEAFVDAQDEGDWVLPQWTVPQII